MGGYDPALTRQSIGEAWNASIDAGVTLFDTAEVYGGGESERIIGELLAADPDRAASVVVATKFMPSPWKLQVEKSLLASLRASLERLGLPAVDLYQIHGPISLRSHAALAGALAAAHQEGLVKAVGVSNYSERRDPVDRRCPRAEGHAAGHQPDRVLVAAPVSGDGRPPGRLRGARGTPAGLLADRPGPPDRQVLGRQPTARQAAVLQPSDGGGRPRRGRAPRVGEKHGDKLPSQVALNWVMTKGSVPIPGAKNRHQAEENAGALGWSIDEEDMDRLDAAALPGLSSLQSRIWQHG